jgi:endonuclease YncB( thermonuclease family)
MRFSLLRRLFIAAAVIPTGIALGGSNLAGHASVIDGNTIEIHGQRIRLFGIDAPEAGQPCEAADGRSYRCGQQAALAIADHVGQRLVACDRRDTDRYGRIVAVCRIGGEDLNAWLVSQGWAIAYRRYSTDYIAEEAAARIAKRGIWSGQFVSPSIWRRYHRPPYG